MRITHKYIAVTSDNRYLYIYTHKNGPIEVNPVADIYAATTRDKPGARDVREAQAIVKYNVRWIPVAIETKIIPGEV